MEDNKKIYGTSVLDIHAQDEEVSKENEFFDEKVYNNEEIDNLKNEIKEDYNGEKVSEIISTDAISGIKSSIPEKKSETSNFDEIDENIKKTDIQGKTISNYGKGLIKELIGEEPSDGESSNIAKFFEKFKDKDNEINFDNISLSDIENVLSERIKNRLHDISEDSEYEMIVKRMLQQIYRAYSGVLECRDDVAELNKLCRNISEYNLDKNNENLTNEESFESLSEMADKINRILEVSKHLDDRNTRLRQDYTINDIEIKLYSEVKDCLDDAINFISVKNKLDNAGNKYKKDLKNTDKVNKSIDNWIHDIKHDPYTVYTFPCNDFLNDSESREKIKEFFVNAYIADYIIKNNITTDETDLYEFMKSQSKELLNEYKLKAYYVLYILSRTFKYSKVRNDNLFVRKLSYTLDLISKLGVNDNRERFINISNYIYNSLT